MHKLNTEQTSTMKHHAPATTKQQQAEKFARILSAMSADNDSEGLIRAFRQQQASADGVKNAKAPTAAPNGTTAAADAAATIGLSSTPSSTDSEQGPVTPNAAAAAEAAAAATAAAAAAAAPDSGSTITFRPTDPIVLDAYRMLATSPTVPPVSAASQLCGSSKQPAVWVPVCMGEAEGLPEEGSCGRAYLFHSHPPADTNR